MSKSMRLITSYWGETKTFRMMPITKDCPYVEAIFDLHTGILAVMGVVVKDKVQMLPRLDDNGNIQKAKQPRDNGNTYKEERRIMKQYPEYYIIEEKEMIEFIEMFAQNADTYDYKQYIAQANRSPSADDIMVPEQKPIVNLAGVPLNVEE